jgi:Response regulator of the LytR/AlgR family
MKILIVEDQPIIAMDLELIIEEAGHEVIGLASDRNEALSLAHLADAAFVDCRLRDGGTGPETARILADRHGLAVFHVTGSREMVPEEDMGSVMGVIDKPYSLGSIIEALEIADASMGAAKLIA